MTLDQFQFTMPDADTNGLALQKAKATDGDQYVISFSNFFTRCVLELGHKLHHPIKDQLALPSGFNFRWRFKKGIWITFGTLTLSCYSRAKKQIRATLYYSSEPRGNDSEGKTEISWLLEESHIVLPALIKSLNTMNYEALEATKLFRNEKIPGRTQDYFYIWTIKGEAV